jgi:hypothetical protein
MPTQFLIESVKSAVIAIAVARPVEEEEARCQEV